MSENQNNNPQAHNDTPKQPNQKSGNGRHHHRRRSHGPRPQQEREGAQNQSQQKGAGDARQGNREDNQNANRQQNNNRPQKNNPEQKKQQGNQNQQGAKKNGKHNNRGRGSQKGNGRREPEGRLYNPYEAPDKTEIELSELRAKIVMQAADGTKPIAYSVQPSIEPKKSVLGSEPKVENEAPMPELSLDDYPALDAAQKNDEGEKVEVVGIRFRSSGKMYYFDPQGIAAKKGEFAIVETTRGPEFGDVCLGNTMVNASDTVSPLRPLIRIATPADIAKNAENREKEKNALKICQEKIEAHKLDMKLIDVQYAFDGSKLLFYFASEGRVDFRELVKDLASVFRTRIELRQIGIRDEAKMLGGIGACGRTLCCSTFLPEFAQVSIKMAKDQGLSLNSSKISGVCGRLMCCLRYESEVYTEEIRKTPSNDSTVRTEDGIGTVISSNPLAGTIRVVLKDSPDTAPKQYHRDQVTVLPKERKGNEDAKERKPNEDSNPREEK